MAVFESEADSICDRSREYMRSMSSSRPCVSQAVVRVSVSFVKKNVGGGLNLVGCAAGDRIEDTEGVCRNRQGEWRERRDWV
jgi:hypothetical protein